MSVSLSALRVFVVLVLLYVPSVASFAADADETRELKRAIEALRQENRDLLRRLEALEAKQPERAPKADRAAPPAGTNGRQAERLEERVKELETTKAAQEDAVRSIIRESFSKLGPKINEPAALGGTLGVGLGRSSDFSGTKTSTLGLTSADFELEIQMNPWALGHIKLDYQDGKNILFNTSTGSQASVDRINLDTGYIVLGNAQKFPPLLTVGRAVLPYGASTGHPVTDSLSVASPLTIDTFEIKKNLIGLGFNFPTPALGPATRPVNAPPVRPKVIYPLLSTLGEGFGYAPPPERLKPVAPITLAPAVAPFNTGFYIYEGGTPGALKQHFGGAMGFNTKGDCGRRYEDLIGSLFCPWAAAFDLSYNSSVFNSSFLETEYDRFLSQIGRVPGVAASLKSSLGPFGLVGEWNAATRRARFFDDLGGSVAIQPAAWQVSLGYQLGGNPWVKEIGQQGSYLSIGYSQSRDLAGVTKLINGESTRVGFVPKRRLLLTFGEWVVDGVRFAVEYSRNWDYSLGDGGTGRTATGIEARLTYAW